MSFAVPTNPARKRCDVVVTGTESLHGNSQTVGQKSAPVFVQTSSTQPQDVMSGTAGEVETQEMARNKFDYLLDMCNDMLILIRKLRKVAVTVHDEYIKKGGSELTSEGLYDIMVPLFRKYKLLLNYTSKLPYPMPKLSELNRMKRLYELECEQPDIATLNDAMIDKSNWMEGQFQTFTYFSGFLHSPRYSPRRSIFFEAIPLLPKEIQTRATGAHQHFTKVLNDVCQEIEKKSLGIQIKFLQKTATSSIVEFKFHQMDKDSSVAVVMFKFLLMERFGVFEHINMKAPDEDWDFIDGFTTRTVNPYGRSNYVSYQKLTKQANSQLRSVSCIANKWTTDSFLVFISTFAKLREVFSGKCRGCKKHLKKFLPPTLFDIRQPGFAYHQGC